MLNGKKSIAERIFYNAIESASKKQALEVLPFFDKVIENTGPKRKVVLRRFGGSTYSVPKEVKDNERPIKAISIIVKAVRDLAFSQGKKAEIVLEEVFIQSFENTGPAVNAKDKLHKLAEDNAAFSHFQW